MNAATVARAYTMNIVPVCPLRADINSFMAMPNKTAVTRVIITPAHNSIADMKFMKYLSGMQPVSPCPLWKF